MTKEYLSIENFAGLNENEIELGRMNVFIGPQASGKSVCAKLFFFFKECASGIVDEVMRGQSKVQIQSGHRETFFKYFPPVYWGKGVFKLRYSCGELWIEIERKASDTATIKTSYSPQYNRLLSTARQMLDAAYKKQSVDGASRTISFTNRTFREIRDKVDQEMESPLSNINFFIPAGRSFFSTLRANLFRFLASDNAIDPFPINFGVFYEAARRSPNSINSYNLGVNDNTHLADRMSKLLCGTYKRMKAQDYILMPDNRQIAIENCSSGQQEALPLGIALIRMGGASSGTKTSTIFIEEPEAHLYPSAQREIVHLFVAAMDLSSSSSGQYLITTHSPYILSALNNIMYAGKIARDFPDKRSHVTTVLGEDMLIDPTDVRAYFVSDGRIKSIIDPETGLVNAALLDSVSGELAEEFDKLVDIEYDEKLEEKVA